MIKLMSGFRGDGRDLNTLKDAGGLVPKYLLETHQGDFAGFLACQNKTAGKLGCNCPNMGEDRLYARARDRLTNLLARNAMDIQAHVIFNRDGMLSTATEQDDAYGGHQYKILAEFQLETTVAQAAQVLGIQVRGVNMISGRFRILMDAERIANARLIAMVPHQGIELTFISPVPYRCLKYMGHI